MSELRLRKRNKPSNEVSSHDAFQKLLVDAALEGEQPAISVLRVLSTHPAAPEVFSVLKSQYENSFSQTTYEDLRKVWRLPKDLSDLLEFKAKELLVPKQVISDIVRQINKVLYVNGPLANAPNETVRKRYIDAFVDPIFSLFEGQVINEAESKLESLVSKGRVEYVFKAFSQTILVIIEAKHLIDKPKSYGQIMVELHASDYMNRINNLKIDAVRGCLTTGEYWWWWEYTGDNMQFRVSKELTCLSRDKPFSIKQIAGVLYWMALDGWCKACKIAKPNVYEIANRALSEAEKADNEANANSAHNTIIKSVTASYNKDDEPLVRWTEPM